MPCGGRGMVQPSGCARTMDEAGREYEEKVRGNEDGGPEGMGVASKRHLYARACVLRGLWDVER